MDIINLTRELGKAIQQDQRYLNMQVAKQNSENDEKLNNLIGEFNLKRISINNEAQKPEQDKEKMQKLNMELRNAYAQIMKNPNMTAYNEAKEALDALLKRVNAIIVQSAEGDDPETTDYVEHSCAGDCSSCGGC